MTSSTIIKEMSMDGKTLRLLMQDQTPCVEFQDQMFNHIWVLCQQLCLLNEQAYVTEFAEISNFLWKGQQFRFIDEISAFQKHYLEQIELERKYPSDIFPYRLTDYKTFDVSVMHPPQIKEGHLHYFVCQVSTGLPYRVVCPFPYTSSSPVVHYQILPIKDKIAS